MSAAAAGAEVCCPTNKEATAEATRPGSAAAMSFNDLVRSAGAAAVGVDIALAPADVRLGLATADDAAGGEKLCDSVPKQAGAAGVALDLTCTAA